MPTTAYSQTSDDPSLSLLAACRKQMGEPSQEFALTASGTSTQDGRSTTMEVTITIRGLHQERWDISRGHDQSSVVRDSGNIIHIRNGVSRQVPNAEPELVFPDMVPAYACTLPELRPVTARYTGHEQMAGTAVDRITLSRVATSSRTSAAPELGVVDVFLDTETHQVVGIRKTALGNGAVQNKRILEFIYANYESVNGISVPRDIERRMNGVKMEKVHFDELSEAQNIFK